MSLPLHELRSRASTRSALGLLLALSLASSGLVAACGSNGNGETFPDSGTTGGDTSGSSSGVTGGDSFGNTGGFGNIDGSVAEEAASSLVFDPPNATIVVDGTGSLERTFTLKATINGTVKEVQGTTLQFDRPDLAAVTPGAPVKITAKGTFAGTGTLNAVYGGAAAKASVTVIVHLRELNGVDPAVATAIDTASPVGAAPNDTTMTQSGDTAVDAAKKHFIYPYDKTVFPLGLTAPLFMWESSNATDVYRVRLEEQNYVYDYYAAASYTAGTNKAEIRLPQAAWDRVTASNGGAGDTLKMTLSRASGANVYTSVTRTFSIAKESARGAIYYWTASRASEIAEPVGHITKFQLGTGAAPVKLNEGKCMGCHAVSADGTVLTATVQVPPTDPENHPTTTTPYPSIAPFSNWTHTRPWAAFALPAATETKRTTKHGGNTALTPEGKYVVFGGGTVTPTPGSKYLGLAETAKGDLIATSKLDDVKYDLTTKGTYDTAPASMMMPAFSPDGTKLAVVEGGTGDIRDNVIPTAPKGIFYLDFDKATPAFNPNGHLIVKANSATFGTFNGDVVDGTGGNVGLGYPSFSPDSAAIAYHTGKYTTGCSTGCLDPDYDSGEIWLSKVDGSKHVRLDALNGGIASDPRSHVNREPTFNPVERGGYFWVVFTSMRTFGHYNQPEGTGGAPAGGDYNKLDGLSVNANRRLWVAAIDKTTGTVDPSHPGFYLEGQDKSPNMRGFWALAACTATPPSGATGPACSAGFECCSGFCDKNQCVDPQQLACRSIGDTCSTAADCCNSSVVTCSNNKCQAGGVK